MFSYALRRIVLLVPVLIGLSILVFAIGRLLPGDPVSLAAGPNASSEQVAALRAEFGMDLPIPVQYYRYVSGLMQGDWGRSLMSRGPVLDDLKVYLPATLELVFAAMALAIVIGILAGLLSAVYRNGWVDYLVRLVSLASISMPRFFLGLLLQLVFAMWLGWAVLGGLPDPSSRASSTANGMSRSGANKASISSRARAESPASSQASASRSPSANVAATRSAAAAPPSAW